MQYAMLKMVYVAIEGLVTLAQAEMVKNRCVDKWLRVSRAAGELVEAIRDVQRHY